MTDHDNPYDLLAEDHDGGHRWAFGTGFTDPLAGIDTSVPPGVDAAALARFCLALGDDALIYSHRLQAWRHALFGLLSAAPDPVLAAIAAKGANELAYHRDYAAQWVIRLGDGTELSHARMRAALDALWPLTAELFLPDDSAFAHVDAGT